MPDYSNDYSLSYTTTAGSPSCTIRFRCFDTPNEVTVHGCAERDDGAEALLGSVRRLCLDLHLLWSFSLEGSDIARVNAPVAEAGVDERTASLLSAMKSFNAVEPAFDFTVGPASFLWKRAKTVPDESDIARFMRHVGAEKVAVSGRTVRKADSLVQVDVGGAAKGFAADLIAGMLRDAGVESADIDLGGNLYLMGNHPEGRPWRVSVRIPEGLQVDPVIVTVRDRSVVTSGTYERFADIDGRRFGHIVDPRTGWPVESDIVSATVVADSSLQADMIATTALMAGSCGLAALAARHPHCSIIAITAHSETAAFHLGERVASPADIVFPSGK